jgi:chorismate mutase/prephenate dehydrogenase
MTKRELEALREEILRIDRDIVELVLRRQEVADEIGRVKSKDGLRLRDSSREKKVISGYEDRARALGLDPVVGRKVAELMVSLSVSEQRKKKLKPLKHKRALVVGGAGRMGEWTCRMLSTRGADVHVVDPRRRLEGYRNLKKIPTSLDQFEVTVIASPLGLCPKDLDAVLALRPKGVVFDLCSVKAHIASKLRSAAAQGFRVTSVHPMFGPNAPSPRARNVVICRCGSPEADRMAFELFSSEGADVSTVDLEAHDELMAYVLGLSHLCTMLFSGTLARSGRRPEDLRAVQGPSFARLFKTATELSSESRRIYHDIQALNPNTRHLVTTMEEVLRELRKASLDSDPDKFRYVMDSNGRYLEVS